MNILLLANHLNVGGITSYLLTLGSGLKEQGHQVYLASSGGQLQDEFEHRGIALIKAPLNTKSAASPKIILSYLKLKKLGRILDIGLVHSNSRTTQVLGCLLARALGKPHVFTCHGFFRPKLSRRSMGCWGEGVIAISPQVKEHLVRDFKLAANKITLIPNGIDTEKFGDLSARQELRAKLGISADGLLIGVIARLSDVKGHVYLLQAMPLVLKSFPAARLLIIGEGKEEGVLEERTRHLGITDNVIFIPRAQNTREWLSAMDIFVLPSLQEGLGLALMEAMAQGLAVAGSSVGGIPALIRDQVNGLLVKPADPQELAQAITRLLADPLMRQRLGGEARKFIQANFAKKEMVEKTQEMYRQLIANER